MQIYFEMNENKVEFLLKRNSNGGRGSEPPPPNTTITTSLQEGWSKNTNIA